MEQVRTLYRHADVRLPFLWEHGAQPAARWHGDGDGPAQYLADTPDGAWAEFCRHEEITDPADLAGVRRRLWAVEVPTAQLDAAAPLELPGDRGVSGYPSCQAAAAAARADGASAVVAPSAALRPGGAAGLRTDGGLMPADGREGRVWALFGRRPDLVAWAACDPGRPPMWVLDHTVPLDG